MTLRIALLEIDHWHVQMYLDALKTLDVRIVAVSDADFPRARRLAESIGCRAYPSAAELLDREIVDFAFAFAPHYRMFPLVKLLVERRLPFAMEKPMALKASDLATLLPRAEASGVFAGVAFVRRMGGIGGAMLSMRDEFGDLIHYQSRFMGGTMQRYIDFGCPWMLNVEQAGGGCMINFGTHYFDLFLALTNERVTRVYCQTSRRFHGGNVEDLATALLQTESGVLATLESGYLLPDDPKEDVMTLRTTTAYASNEKGRWGKPTITFKDGRVVQILEPEPFYADYVTDVVRRFQAGEPPLADLRSMVRVLECVNAAYESARTGQPVLLG